MIADLTVHRELAKIIAEQDLAFDLTTWNTKEFMSVKHWSQIGILDKGILVREIHKIQKELNKPQQVTIL